MLLVLDLLITKAGNIHIANATSADLENITQNALCAFQNVAVPSMDRDKLAALTLYVLNEFYCGS